MLNLRSTLRKKLFSYYFTNTSASHYVRELASVLGVDVGNLARELSSLEREGVFISEMRGKQKYFNLNAAHPLFEEYKNIVFKTVGIAGQLRAALIHISGITEAYLYGSFARGEADALSDVDVLVIGEPDPEVLAREIEVLEKTFRREINYMIMNQQEVKIRRTNLDAFLKDVWKQPHIKLVP